MKEIWPVVGNTVAIDGNVYEFISRDLMEAHRDDFDALVRVKTDSPTGGIMVGDGSAIIGFQTDQILAGDTITIFGTTYEFVEIGAMAGDGHLAVEMGDSAGATAHNFAVVAHGTVETRS